MLVTRDLPCSKSIGSRTGAAGFSGSLGGGGGGAGGGGAGAGAGGASTMGGAAWPPKWKSTPTVGWISTCPVVSTRWVKGLPAIWTVSSKWDLKLYCPFISSLRPTSLLNRYSEPAAR